LHIAIYTDNANTNIDMFNTLCAQPSYNPLLLTAVDLTLNYHVEFQVFHILGSDNIVADVLSCFHFDVVGSFAPFLHVLQFEPPQLTLGGVPS
jgi:hypothetical protein